MKPPARPGETQEGSRTSSSHQATKRLTTRGIGAAGVGIGGPGGEQGLVAGALKDGRDRGRRIEAPGSGQKGSLSRGSVRSH